MKFKVQSRPFVRSTRFDTNGRSGRLDNRSGRLDNRSGLNSQVRATKSEKSDFGGDAETTPCQAWVILYELRIRGKVRVPFIIPV